MKHSHPSNVSSDVEPPPTAIPDAGPAPLAPGDDASVEAFVVSAYEAHHAEVFAFLARATRDRTVAEDLLRETYARLTKEVRYGRSPDQVRGWLYRVASTLVVERSGRGATTLSGLGRSRRMEPDRTTTPSPLAGGPEERATDMERVLVGLSTDARVALLLSSEGFAGEEIATAIGRSTSATRTLLGLARARVRVRRALFADEAR